MSELKGMFSVVFQDYAKYSVTMGENIRLGDLANQGNGEQSGIQDAKDAIKLVDLNDAVEKLPHGMDTSLGLIKPDAVDLSGGEWQRIVLARALVNKAQLRILDEPTAALDPVAESNIYTMFDRISKGQTTIFITHRLGAAKLSDQIVVIDDGTVVEKGSHDELMSNKQLYYVMFESQRRWYE